MHTVMYCYHSQDLEHSATWKCSFVPLFSQPFLKLLGNHWSSFSSRIVYKLNHTVYSLLWLGSCTKLIYVVVWSMKVLQELGKEMKLKISLFGAEKLKFMHMSDLQKVCDKAVLWKNNAVGLLLWHSR